MANLIQFIRRMLWEMRYPWPKALVDEGIRPLRISICPEARHPECMELHCRNEAHGVPPDHRDRYLMALRSEEILTLLVEEEGQLVGTFGIQYGVEFNTYWICYFMVAPEHHRRRIGTTMFFAALAMLPENHLDLMVAISALPTAADFYYRFGFRKVGDQAHSSGQVHQVAILPITSAVSAGCRSWLASAGATLPEENYRIPRGTMRESEGNPETKG